MPDQGSGSMQQQKPNRRCNKLSFRAPTKMQLIKPGKWGFFPSPNFQPALAAAKATGNQMNIVCCQSTKCVMWAQNLLTLLQLPVWDRQYVIPESNYVADCYIYPFPARGRLSSSEQALQLALSRILSCDSITGRIAFILCQAINRHTNSLQMPTTDKALQIISLASDFEIAKSSCYHCQSEICQMPSEFTARLVRTTCCGISTSMCPVMIMLLTSKTPSIFSLPHTVGYISDSTISTALSGLNDLGGRVIVS